MSDNKELPRYLCHKEVRALKIESIEQGERSATLVFVDKRYAPLEVTYDWINSHGVVSDGYYVVYKDGYASWSPRRAFESGYRPIADNAMKTKLTPEDIEDVIDGETYLHPSGTLTICIMTLRNGAKVTGDNYGAIDKTQHDWEEGKRLARAQAVQKVFELEGYLLREKLFLQQQS